MEDGATVPRSEFEETYVMHSIFLDCSIGQPMGHVDTQLIMQVSSEVLRFDDEDDDDDQPARDIGNHKKLAYVHCTFGAKSR